MHSCSAHDRNSQSSSAPSKHCRVLKLSTPADTLVYKLRPAEQSRSATAWTIDDVPGVVEAKRGATGGGGFVRPASPPLPACDKGATRGNKKKKYSGGAIHMFTASRSQENCMPVHVRCTHSTKVRGYFPVSAGTAGPKNRGSVQIRFSFSAQRQ